MIKYIFRDEPLAFKNSAKASAQKIGEALERIAGTNDGRLTPKAVVDAARDRRHVLHKHFEWNDAAAAEAFRLEQARTLIRVVRVEEGTTSDGTARAFLSVADKGGVSYHHIDEVKSSNDLQIAVLKAAERDLDAFEIRYRDLVDICDLVKVARERVIIRRTEVESRASV